MAVASCFAVALLLLPAPSTPGAAEAPREPDGGQGRWLAEPDRIDEAERLQIWAEIAAERARRLPSPVAIVGGAEVRFSLPLRQVQLGYLAFAATGNFVDHDPDFPDQLLDWSCGGRTYDRADGYNHSGTDLFGWPFAWWLMDHDRLEAIAPANGILMAKHDGVFDRSCDCGPANNNYVVLEHADGSTTWYLHLKSGSVTSKSVGSAIAIGERLGVVGSSGCSLSPHLHFEVFDPSDATVDPYAGACDQLAPEPAWEVERGYREPAISHLASHFAPPQFPPCPQTEVPRFRRLFAAGDTVLLAGYFRDQEAGVELDYAVYRPDGSLFDAWSHASPVTYDASYWYWTIEPQLADGAGRWRFVVDLTGEIRERAFWVGVLFADDFEDASTAAWSASP